MKNKHSDILVTTLLALIAVNDGITSGGVFGNLLFGFGVVVIFYELAIYIRAK